MPYSAKARFDHEKLFPKSRCDKKSFRTVKQGKHRIVICCEKGLWDSDHQICRVGTKAVTLLHPKKERGF